jgi:hypothetical protein
MYHNATSRRDENSKRHLALDADLVCLVCWPQRRETKAQVSTNVLFLPFDYFLCTRMSDSRAKAKSTHALSSTFARACHAKNVQQRAIDQAGFVLGIVSFGNATRRSKSRGKERKTRNGMYKSRKYITHTKGISQERKRKGHMHMHDSPAA